MSGDPYCPTHGFLPCSCDEVTKQAYFWDLVSTKSKYGPLPTMNEYYVNTSLDQECDGVLVEKITALEKENAALRQRNLELEAEVVYFREKELRQKFPKRGRR